MSKVAEAAQLARLVEDRLGVRVEAVEPLAGGIGARRFYRITTAGDPASLVARIEAAEPEGRRPLGAAAEPPLEPVRAMLAREGLPVPARYGADEAAGIELLEDLGSRCLADAVEGVDGATRRALYREAVAWVPRLQACRDPGGLPAFQRRLDAGLIAFKGELFAEHGLAAALGRAPRPFERAAVTEAFAWIAETLADAPLRLAHRDFQSHNLLVPAEAPPGARIFLIDLQGAFLAPPEYDLVCLLRDSYVELPDDEVASLCEEVAPRLPDAPDPETFDLRFDLLTLTRKAKDHARFVQAAAAGDERFGRYRPTTARALAAAARRRAGLDPRLARLAELMTTLLEEETRCER